MIDQDLDQVPAVTGTETTGGTDKAPASPPPADVGHEADHAELDLLDADDGEEGGDADGEPGAQEAADADDADRPAWLRPEGLEGGALAEWKEQQGLPTDSAGYRIDLDLREGEAITETGQQLIEGLKGFAVEHDLPPPAVNGLVKWYDAQVKAQQAKLAEADKALRTEAHDALTERWGSSYADHMEVAKEGARVLPTALRAMLKDARTPDGRRIAHTAELAQALFEIGRLRTKKGTTVPPTDEARLAEINKVRDSDIDRYQREGLGKEALDLMRKAEAKGQPAPVALSPTEAEEERALVQLMSEDVGIYQSRQWRGSGKTGSERLLEIQRKRNGAAA